MCRGGGIVVYIFSFLLRTLDEEESWKKIEIENRAGTFVRGRPFGSSQYASYDEYKKRKIGIIQTLSVLLHGRGDDEVVSALASSLSPSIRTG